MYIGSLIPAYGRDYRAKAAILSDLATGKDFSLQTYDGAGYVTADELDRLHPAGWLAQARYQKFRKVCMIASAQVAKERAKIAKAQVLAPVEAIENPAEEES